MHMTEKKENKYAVVCGSLNMDLVCRGPRIPVAGETILGYDFTTTIGGKGGNQAAALAKLGICTHMIGCVGDDAYGKEIIEALNQNHVVTDAIKSVKGHTGTAHIMIDDEGENNIVVIPSANYKLTEKMVLESEALVKEASVLLAQLEVNLETIKTFLNLGKKYQIMTVLNPAPVPPEGISDDLLSLVDLLTPNETEMKLLTGIEVVDQNSFEAASKILHEKGVKRIICTMGSKGSYYSDDDSIIYQNAHTVKAIDTTCAGDSFTGAVLVKLMEGCTIKEALAFATKVSAITVTRKGAQNSIPSREEAETFIF